MGDRHCGGVGQRLKKGEKMRQVCMVCGILYGLKEPLEDDSETHGLCEECFPLEMKKIEMELKKADEIETKDGI